MVNPTQDPPTSSNPFQSHSSYPLFFSSTNSSENIHNAMDEFSNPNFSNATSHDAHSNPLFYSSSSNPSTLFNSQPNRNTTNPFNNPSTSSGPTTTFQLSPYLNNQPSPPQNPNANPISLDEFLSLSNSELYMTSSNPPQHAPTGSGGNFAPQQMANRNANQSTINPSFQQQMSSSPHGFLHPLFQNASGTGNTGNMNPPSPPLHEDSLHAPTTSSTTGSGVGNANTGFQNSMNNPNATSTMNPGSMFFPLFANPSNANSGPSSYLSALLDSAAHANSNQSNAAAAALMNVNPLLQNTGNFMFNMPTNPNNPPNFYGMDQVSSPNLNMFGMPQMAYDMSASPLQKSSMKLQPVASSKKKSIKSEAASPSTKQTSFINSPVMGIGSSSSSNASSSNNRTASYYDKANVIITNNDAIKHVTTLPSKQYPHHIRMQQQGTDTDDGTKLIPTTLLSSPQLHQQGNSNSNSSHSMEPGEHSDQESQHQGVTVEQAHPLSFSLDPAPSDQINTFVKPARKSSKYFIPYFPQKLYCAPYKYDVRIHLPENIPQEELDNDYKISFKLLDGETKKALKQNTKGEASISIEKCSKGKPGGGIAEEEILAHQEASHITMYRICFTVCSFHNFRRPFLLATKLKPLLKGSVSPQTNQVRKMIVHESDLFYIYARKNNREAETWGDSNLTTAMTKKASGHASASNANNNAMVNNVFDMSFPIQQGDTQEYMQFTNSSPNLMEQPDAKKKGNNGKKRKRGEEQQQQLVASPVQSAVATPSVSSTNSTASTNTSGGLNFNNLPTFHIQSDQQGKKIRLSISDPAPLLQSPLLFQQIASNLNQQYRSPSQSNTAQQSATSALLDTSNLMMPPKEEEQQRVPSELQHAFELKDPLEEAGREERNPKSVGSTEHTAHATNQDTNVSSTNTEDNARKTDASDTMEDYSARMRQNMINESGESSHFSTEIDHLLY